MPDDLAAMMPEDEVWKSGDQGFMGPVNKITSFLQKNSVAVDDELMAEIWEWANAQWCAKDPKRCRGKKVSKRPAEKVGTPTQMHWAGGFWTVWNAAISAPVADPVQLNQRFIWLAWTNLSGPWGCRRCAKHFRLHLADFPVERGDDITKARVWLWHVHNLTRENLKPVPYAVIAKRYGWADLTDAELAAILKDLKAPEPDLTPITVA